MDASAVPAPKTVPVRSARPRGPAAAAEGFATSPDGTRIHWSSVGDGGPTLVCCDGLGCDGYIWKYLAEDLARDHRVVRWHYRGHGTSDPPRDRSRMGIDHLCEDLTAVLDALDLDECVLLGHSLGVQVTLEYWKKHPERVVALVPMCGSYGRPVDTFRDAQVMKAIFPFLHGVIKRARGLVQAGWRILDSELAFQVAMRSEVNGDLVRRPDFRPYLTHLARMDVELFFDLLADAGRHDALPFLPDIDVPTLVVAGEHDVFTPAWLSNVMHARIPESELCTVPTGSHTAPIEMPELVNLRLRRFLEERVHPVTGR